LLSEKLDNLQKKEIITIQLRFKRDMVLTNN
jgi:hypothetical protein